jgi:hypothetical protein
MEKDISANILQNVLQIGHLDHRRAIDALMKMTNSQDAQFFEVFSATQIFLCRYSSSDRYILGQEYTFEDLPNEQYPIFHKNNIIAIISLDKLQNFEDMSDDFRQRIHDSICIGLVMGNLNDSKFSFTMSVCQTLSQVVTQILESFSELSQKTQFQADSAKNVKTINDSLTQVISILYDTIDYIEIDSEKAVLQKNLVDISALIDETLVILGTNTPKEIDDGVPTRVFMDKDRVQTMLISTLKKVQDLTDVHLQISYADYSTLESQDVFLIFRVFSYNIKTNQEIMKRFRVQNVSVSSLDIFVVKRLCENMKGTFEVSENGLLMKINADVPGETDAFYNKKVLVGTRDDELSRNFVQLFSELGSKVTFITSSKPHMMNRISDYDLVVVDFTFTEIARYAKRRHIPVIGVFRASEVSTIKIGELYDVLLTIPVTAHEIKVKGEKLLRSK